MIPDKNIIRLRLYRNGSPTLAIPMELLASAGIPATVTHFQVSIDPATKSLIYRPLIFAAAGSCKICDKGVTPQ